ncbi:MAG TPA: hypothetical protein VGE39_18710 [Prosthecobacter sp.]
MDTIRIVTEAEFEAVQAQFQKAHADQEGHLPQEEQAAHYNQFYDLLVAGLQTVGSLAEGSSEGDFVTSCFVDPSFVTVVVSTTATVLKSGALEVAHRAIVEAGGHHMVVFDTGSYIAVLPDGSVIGYSAFEDLG